MTDAIGIVTGMNHQIFFPETQCSRTPDDLVLTDPIGAVTRGSVPAFCRDVGTQRSFLYNAFISRYGDASPLLRTPPLELNAV